MCIRAHFSLTCGGGNFGLYRYKPVNGGITPVHVNPVWRFVHFERLRLAGF